MANGKTDRERIVLLEQSKTDCQKNYDREFKELKERVGKVEAWKDKILLLVIGILLTTLTNLAVAVVALVLKK